MFRVIIRNISGNKSYYRGHFFRSFVGYFGQLIWPVLQWFVRDLKGKEPEISIFRVI